MEPRAFKKALGRFFEQSGFSHKGQTWFLDGEETVAVVNVQKNQYDTDAFLNLGFWLKALGKAPALPPAENLCHARIRAESLFPDLSPEISRLLNRDAPIPDDERIAGLEKVMTQFVIPFMLDGSTAEGLRTHLLNGRFRRGLVHVDAKRLLGVA